MRILITADVFPPEMGGTAIHVPSIADGLAQQGHAVRVLVGTRDPSRRAPHGRLSRLLSSESISAGRGGEQHSACLAHLPLGAGRVRQRPAGMAWRRQLVAAQARGRPHHRRCFLGARRGAGLDRRRV